jgi:hypothetical protein
MEYMHGCVVSNPIQQPTETDQDEVILPTDVYDRKLDYLYEQIANYMLQFSQLSFSAIGAIRHNPSTNQWTASE